MRRWCVSLEDDTEHVVGFPLMQLATGPEDSTVRTMGYRAQPGTSAYRRCLSCREVTMYTVSMRSL